MRPLRWTIAGSLLLGALGCGQDRGADSWPISRAELEGGAAPGAAPGEATYRQYCIGCHGADGRGNGGTTGADFTGPASPLRAHADAELAVSVRDGKRGASASMPAHSPVLSDAQIAQVLAYVRAQFAR